MLRLSAALLLALSFASLGCEEPCAATCKRVAACKLEARQGEKMLGERDMPADPMCLERCSANKADFGSCEGKRRDCKGVLGCITY